MQPVGILAVILGIAIIHQIAKRAPARLAAIVALAAFTFNHVASVRVANQIKGMRADALAAPDPWATPSREARRLLRRSAVLAVRLTELESLFPDVAVSGRRLGSRFATA